MIAFVDGGAWLAVLALLGAVVLAVRLASPRARTQREQRRRHQELASANGLDDAESALLWRIANAARLAEPAAVFVRPSLLDATSAGLDPATAARLRQKLFAR